MIFVLGDGTFSGGAGGARTDGDLPDGLPDLAGRGHSGGRGLLVDAGGGEHGFILHDVEKAVGRAVASLVPRDIYYMCRPASPQTASRPNYRSFPHFSHKYSYQIKSKDSRPLYPSETLRVCEHGKVRAMIFVLGDGTFTGGAGGARTDGDLPDGLPDLAGRGHSGGRGLLVDAGGGEHGFILHDVEKAVGRAVAGLVPRDIYYMCRPASPQTASRPNYRSFPHFSHKYSYQIKSKDSRPLYPSITFSNASKSRSFPNIRIRPTARFSTW
jgi:hypothetical protein